MIVVSRPPARATFGDVATDTWPSTGAIDTETSSLQLSVQQLGRDIFDDSSVQVDSDSYQTMQNAWNTFVADFDQWVNASWFWNPSRRDELVSYRARYNALLAQWKGMGVTSAAAPVPNATLPPSPLSQASDILTKLVWVVGIGAGLYVASTVYKEVRGRT